MAPPSVVDEDRCVNLAHSA